MLLSCYEIGSSAKTEPLLTESMGGGGKITRGACQASLNAVSLCLSPACCQHRGKTPRGPDEVKTDQKRAKTNKLPKLE